MTTANHITASCVISNGNVYKNGNKVFTCGDTDVSAFFLSVYKYLDTHYIRFYKMDNLSKLGWLASEILLKDSFEKEKYQPEQTGLLLFNSNASLDTDIRYLETVKDIASPSVFVYTLPNIMIGEICIRNHFKGETAFFINEGFDSVFMHQYVNDLVDNSILQACICGWVELMNDHYKAVLFLVEKEDGKNAVLFNRENIDRIFRAENS